MNDQPEWFAAKRFGFGAGLPIAWQGWAVSAVFAGAIIIAAYMLSRRPLALLSVSVPAIALFLIICARTTRGGWRWRWGEDD